jgi:hypothetical protein
VHPANTPTPDPAPVGGPSRAARLFYRVLAVVFVLLAVAMAVRGNPWYHPVGAMATAGIMALGSTPPMWRRSVSRTGPQEVLCRYAPWYQSYAWMSLVLVPLLAITMNTDRVILAKVFADSMSSDRGVLIRRATRMHAAVSSARTSPQTMLMGIAG